MRKTKYTMDLASSKSILISYVIESGGRILVNMTKSGFSLVGKSKSLLKNTGADLINGFDTFESLTRAIGIADTTDGWVTETGEPLSKYLVELSESDDTLDDFNKFIGEWPLKSRKDSIEAVSELIDTSDTMEETETNAETLVEDDLSEVESIESEEAQLPIKAITKQTTVDTYETEILNLSLSDKSMEKQANYIADAISKKFEENTKKQKNEATSIVENETTKETKEYTLDNFNEKVQGVDADLLVKLLHIKKALILISPPGTGKTVTARNLAKYITKEENSSRVIFVSFNQETSYTDIIGGYRNVGEAGEQDWRIVKGSFTKICEEAVEDPKNIYIYIIDEINRANTERVLGEGLTAIAGRGVAVQTNNGFDLIVPNNLYIIATMNSMDASVASLDTAMLDRFMIFNMPELKVKSKNLSAPVELHSKIDNVIKKLEEINKILEKDTYKKKDNRIGNRALYEEFNTLDELEVIVKYDIIPKIEIKLSGLPDTDENKKEINKLVTELKDSLKDEKHEE